MRSLVVVCVAALLCKPAVAGELGLEVKQLTSGPHHHFFGYIGQQLCTPWNESGRYILSLRAPFHDRMPTPEDAADIVLIDSQDGYRVIPIEKTHAWNFQQGTMMNWHPKQAETQFFFNDRDPDTQQVFTVLFDIEQRKRLRAYRFDDVYVANGGVAPTGEFFLAINYARMARLRPVTGYPEAADPTAATPAPENDGIFRVDIESGKRQLLVSFRRLRDLLRGRHDKIDEMGFFINHSLCSRDAKNVYFYARARYGDRAMAIDVPCSLRTDGTNLRPHEYIGGHPEWDEGPIVIGGKGPRQVRFDIDKSQIIGQIGDNQTFPKPGGDVSLSRQADWFANGYSEDRATNSYVLFRRSDGARLQSRPFARGPYQRGPLRIDPAPRWNRTDDAILVPGMTADGTRQLHLISIVAE